MSNLRNAKLRKGNLRKADAKLGLDCRLAGALNMRLDWGQGTGEVHHPTY